MPELNVCIAAGCGSVTERKHLLADELVIAERARAARYDDDATGISICGGHGSES
jgi:hypothetical protein